MEVKGEEITYGTQQITAGGAAMPVLHHLTLITLSAGGNTPNDEVVLMLVYNWLIRHLIVSYEAR